MRKVRTATDWHNDAMIACDYAAIAAKKEEPEEVDKWNRRALRLELVAAYMVKDEENSEPTRSILFKSAGWIAMSLHEYKLARKLAEEGMDGSPPEEVKEELQDILDRSALIMNPTGAPPKERKSPMFLVFNLAYIAAIFYFAGLGVGYILLGQGVSFLYGVVFGLVLLASFFVWKELP